MNKHASRRNWGVIFALILGVIPIGTGGPVWAADGGARLPYAEGPPSTERVRATILTFKVPAGAGPTTQQDVHCDVWFAPAPQYDFSGGYRRVHYGGVIICNTVGTLHIAVNLYEVVGSGEFQHREFVAQYGPHDVVGTNHGGSSAVGCFAGTGKWQTTIFATWNAYPADDYPAESNIYTLPCN